jgi:photosystem II stability/assembly factor-like uncharacterized protein
VCRERLVPGAERAVPRTRWSYALIITLPAWALLPPIKALKCMFMLPKRLLALTLFASALVVVPPCVLRAQWVQTNGPYGVHATSFAVIDSNLFVGTGDGVFLSTDTGKNWKAKNKGLTGTRVFSLGSMGNRIFAGTDSGIFRSTNNGGKWI